MYHKGELGKMFFTGHGALGCGLPADKIKADHIFLWMWLRGSNVILKKMTHGGEKRKKKKKSSVVQVVSWCWWTFIHFCNSNVMNCDSADENNHWIRIIIIIKKNTSNRFAKQNDYTHCMYACIFGLTSTWQQDNFICKADARLEKLF